MRSTKGDGRYSVAIAATGAFEPADGLKIGHRWVVRFVGDRIGDAVTESAARQIADDFDAMQFSRSYEESEIYRAIAGTDGKLRVKFYGDKGDSKFLSISPATARKVAALIAEDADRS